MDEEMREKIVAAIERAFRTVGAEDYEQGMQQTKVFIDIAYESIGLIQIKDGLRAVLDAVAVTEEQGEGLMLVAMEYLPQLLRLGFKMIAKHAATDLPAIGDGRPRATTPKKSTEIADYVFALYRNGTPLNHAKDRAAQKYNLGRRTIDRIWANRNATPADSPTLKELLSYLSSGD